MAIDLQGIFNDWAKDVGYEEPKDDREISIETAKDWMRDALVSKNQNVLDDNDIDWDEPTSPPTKVTPKPKSVKSIATSVPTKSIGQTITTETAKQLGSIKDAKLVLAKEPVTTVVQLSGDPFKPTSVPVQNKIKETIVSLIDPVTEMMGLDRNDVVVQKITENIANNTAYRLTTRPVGAVNGALRDVNLIAKAVDEIGLVGGSEKETVKTSIDLKSMLEQYKAVVVPSAPINSEVATKDLMMAGLISKNMEVTDWIEDTNPYPDIEWTKVVLADQMAEARIPIAEAHLNVVKNPTASNNDRLYALSKLKEMGVNTAETTMLVGDELKATLYEQLANASLERQGISDAYVAYGNPNAIYSTSGLTRALFGKAAIKTEYPSYFALKQGINMSVLIQQELREKYGSDLSEQQILDLAQKYPSVATSLLTGDIRVNDAKAAWNLFVENTTLPASGVPKTDPPFGRIAGQLVSLAEYGLSEEELKAYLYDVRETYNEAGKKKIDDWIHSEKFETDQKTAYIALHPLKSLEMLVRDPEFQVPLMVGAALTGGLAGFAVKGLAGAASGVLMAPFVSTESGQFASMTVFADAQVKELASYGVKDASEGWNHFISMNKSLQTLYAAALRKGDLAGADKRAFAAIDNCDRAAKWIQENMFGLEKAGLLETVTEQLLDTGAVWEATIIGDEETRDFIEVKIELPEGWVPGSDKCFVNGVLVPYLESRTLKIPPGEYEIGYSIGNYKPEYIRVSTSDWGIPLAKAGITDPEQPIPLWVFTEYDDELKLVAEARTERSEGAIAVMLTEGYVVPVSLPDGWEYKDPKTGEWKTEGDVTLTGYQTTYLELRDPEGYERYTSIRPTADYLPMVAEVTNSAPYVKDANGYPVILKNQFTEQYGDGKGGLVVNFGTGVDTRIYIDGWGRHQGETVVLKEGTHVVTVERPGYEPVSKVVEVRNGVVEYLNLIPTYKAELDANPHWVWEKGASVIIIDPALPKDGKYTLDGQVVVPGQEVVTTPGTHSFIAELLGKEPAVRTISTRKEEVSYIAEIPTYSLKTTDEEKSALWAAKYGAGTSVIIIDPTLDPEGVYTLDGEVVTPGQEVITTPGQHAFIARVKGKEPEVRSISTRAEEINYVAEIPTYNAKSTASKSSGGGGGGGGSSSGYKATTVSTTKYTTISFGNVISDCYVTLDGVDIVPEIDVKYEIEPGYHTVTITCPDNMGKVMQIYCIAKQNLHINPVLEELAPPEEEETEEEEEQEQEQEQEEEVQEDDVYYVTFSTDPQGAKILINHAFTGEWTPTAIPLLAGIYYLELYKSGYNLLETYMWVGPEVLFGQEALDMAYSLGLDIPT